MRTFLSSAAGPVFGCTRLSLQGDTMGMRAIALTFRSTTMRVVEHRPLAFVLALAIGVAPTGDALAGPYPSKPIQIISPFSAGSAPDALARLVAQRMSERLGQNITVENRPGAGTTIAPRPEPAPSPTATPCCR